MTIKAITTYVDDDNFTYEFNPIEETIIKKKTTDGFKVGYLVQDDDSDFFDDEFYNENIVLINYHREFNHTREEIITRDEIEDYLINGKDIPQEKKYHIFTLSMYAHGGVCFHLGYKSGWDYSNSGIIMVAKALTKSEKKAIKYAKDYIEELNKWLSGEVYNMVVETYNSKKEQIDYDCCGGNIGLDYATKQLKEVLK